MPTFRVLALLSHCGLGKRKRRCSDRPFDIVIVMRSAIDKTVKVAVTQARDGLLGWEKRAGKAWRLE